MSRIDKKPSTPSKAKSEKDHGLQQKIQERAQPKAQPNGQPRGQPRGQPSPAVQGHGKGQSSVRTAQHMNAQSREQFHNDLKRSPPKQFDKETSGQKHAQFKNSFHSNRKNNWTSSRRVNKEIFRDNPGCNNWFNDRFFERHNFRPGCFVNNANWWGCPQWGLLCNWFPWGWTYPYYYDDSGYYYLLSQEFGYDEPIAPQQPEEEAPQQPSVNVYQQNQQGSQTVQDEWMPLGVFAVGKNDIVAAFSNMYIQLAVNKQGDISGTYYNASIDETQSIEGAVDQQTQQAIWKITDNQSTPLMIAGMYNLTQDVVPIQVQFQDGTVQSWLLVRMNKN